jgi:hypothetical protein
MYIDIRRFVCFNNLYKVDAAVFAAWMKVFVQFENNRRFHCPLDSVLLNVCREHFDETVFNYIL